ncbi:GNAT family N-acetyltransferase [Caldimonas tepidiphila]|uniref:GNAT family N-acetyltransferase n=1 Tax=Caldimonas tepidiphila TaxID=2315841 RepID=UPI000E5B9B33|nr:GNAT family N-acetyltransferase [Caldimonas tepidiphila]
MGSSVPTPRSPHPDSPSGSAASRHSWVPIRSLAPRHRGRILAHLLALDIRDRYLRFGHPAKDAQIERYVQALDFERDELFGIFNRKLELIAMAHLAYEEPGASGMPATRAEFGVSVLEKARGRGFGARLFDHAVMHARNRHIETLYIHALTENTAMLRIARNAGAEVVRDGSEAEAYLTLPPDTFATHVEALFEDQAAEVDYQFKRNARRLAELMETMAGMQARLLRQDGGRPRE